MRAWSIGKWDCRWGGVDLRRWRNGIRDVRVQRGDSNSKMTGWRAGRPPDSRRGAGATGEMLVCEFWWNRGWGIWHPIQDETD
jgi:hypothetical protein